MIFPTTRMDFNLAERQNSGPFAAIEPDDFIIAGNW
ncbi:hypothetical protein ACVIGV_001820 [Rhizobium leguminosarum]